jgi:hypothetical protein
MNVYNLNFIPGHHKQSLIASYVLGLCSFLFVVLGILASSEAISIKEEIKPVKANLKKLEKIQKNYLIELRNAPNKNDIDELSRRIEKLSGVLSLKGLSINRILYELEKTIPHDAYILEFEYPYEDGTARILLFAESEKNMSEVLQGMESNVQIDNVILSGQTRVENHKQAVIADIRFTVP